ncbi:MAG TPA: response regulator [Blastocatellia bacterium]|nr:response regulator [Blastocatellia bacterium]
MPSRILLAVSDPQLRRAATEALQAEKIQSIGAEDGNTALGLLNALSPDVLVAEIALPGKDGYALCQYVRQSANFQSLPVVLLDHHFDAINRKIAVRVGATIYLNQPFTSGELVEVVRRLLVNKAEAKAETETPPVEKKVEVKVAAPPRPTPVATELHATEMALAPYRQKAALLPRDKPSHRPHGYLAFFAVALIVLLVGVALAFWLRAQTADGHLSLAQPAIDVSLPERSSAAAIQPDQAATPQPAAEAGASAESSPQVESRPAAPTAQALNRRVARRAPAGIASLPNHRPKSPTRQQEPPRPVTAAAPAHPGPPAATHRPQDTPAARTSAAKSNPNGNSWQRAGQEMAAAGEHFASGIKHVGKGSGKFFLWLGKKVGSGFKQVGKTVKRAF